MLKVDLHLHTAEDPRDDIRHDAAALVDRAAALGFDALAITLHDRQLADARVADRARDRGIVLLPGIERTIAGRHVLLVNFPQAAEQVRSFDEVARLKARMGGLVIAPHPFYPGLTCLRSLMHRHADLFDAVEWSYFWMRALNFNAPAEFSGLFSPAVSAALARAGLHDASIKLGIKVPQQAMAGLFTQIDDRWALLGSVGWQQWSKYGQVRIGVNDATNPRSLTTDIPFNTGILFFGA